MPAIPVISAIGTVAGVASSIKGASDAKKAANQAANTPAPTVDIAALQNQAQNIAQQNAAGSAALERQYNPGAAELRSGSLEALLSSIGSSPDQQALRNMLAASTGQVRTGVSPISAEQYAAQGANSDLLNSAIAKAQADLALGGELPQDVRNLVARNALAQSGTVSRGLGLGRDITARDLGLTSLQLAQQRLSAAQALGQAQLGANQFNASAQNTAGSQNAQLRQSANQFNAGQSQQANQFDANYFLNQANLLNSIQSGDFARALSAAQLGQSIQQPTSGLDPGSLANIAVGNQNAVANQQQNAAALRVQAGNQLANFGSNLAGAGLGYFASRPTSYGGVQTLPVTTVDTNQSYSYLPGYVPGQTYKF